MKKNVLIVEDNDLNRRLFKDVLAAAGYNAYAADTGEAANRAVREMRPDLILMDICLPDMDGLEIAREIKSDASMSDIPIIALTACAMEGDKDYFLSEGCEGYLSKPISVNGFLQYVQKYLH